jgi:hypothetical protein
MKMGESRYEKYVVRKPARLTPDYGEAVPEKMPDFKGMADTGPLVWVSRSFFKNLDFICESGIISADIAVGVGSSKLIPHTDESDNLFFFLGTDPNDPMDLGAEAEFYLGEGDTLEKILIDTSACVFVPKGVAHFPLIWKNVKRPVVFFVVWCQGERTAPIPVNMAGRPR